MSTELVELIDRYWDLAYAEGREGRTTDTPSGDANATRAAIADELTALTAKVALLTEALDELGSAIDGTTFPANHPIWNARRTARRALSEPDKEGML